MDWNLTVANGVLTMDMPTRLEMVDQAVEAATAFAADMRAPANPDLKIVVRELLMNAIIHGNQQAAQKRVIFKMTYIDGARFKIEVQDEGAGFDLHQVNMVATDEPSVMRKRGLALVTSLAEGLFFNQTGNQATAFINLDKNWPKQN